ncbi:hypothetical protein BLNAU_2786 [Blattamonas nauphoetae]|uniref:Uncharacterized protein n=1 Tax=Blattamonas nauphoetae TaxID=2049346 RepID=A0ABQ9YEC7_9EUKA|nr:hypothetical protein BLNAU_2786 [Blattamonas nauphoetae]
MDSHFWMTSKKQTHIDSWIEANQERVRKIGPRETREYKVSITTIIIKPTRNDGNDPPSSSDHTEGGDTMNIVADNDMDDRTNPLLPQQHLLPHSLLLHLLRNMSLRHIQTRRKKYNWIEANREQKRRRVPRERHEYSVTNATIIIDPTCNDGNPPSSSDHTEEDDSMDNVTDDIMDIVSDVDTELSGDAVSGFPESGKVFVRQRSLRSNVVIKFFICIVVNHPFSTK